jgi:ribosomal 50S subunit-recycling heat shock protein
MADDEARLRQLTVPEESSGQRLDLFLAQHLEEISRARVQLLLHEGSVLIDGKRAKASRKVRSGENISILGEPHPVPLRAMAEDIPLEIVYEDADLAVISKPAGMMVHAGSGATEDARNRGTLVNALLHHMGELSSSSGPLRPGIVHRLDKQTSGLIVVANAHDHAPRRGPLRRLALGGVAADPRAVRQLHSGLGAHRDGPDSSDPRPHGIAGTSCGWRHALRGRFHDCAVRGSRQPSPPRLTKELSACGGARVCSSRERGPFEHGVKPAS